MYDKNVTPWTNVNIREVDDQIKESIKKLSSEDEETNALSVIQHNHSTLTSALGLALCYANRAIKNNTNLNEDVKYRILIVKLFEENASQYMNFMNMIFTAEKLVSVSFKFNFQISKFKFKIVFFLYY